MYDPIKTYNEGYTIPVKQLKDQINAWKTLTLPESPFRIKSLELQLDDFMKNKRQRVIWETYHQMRFHKPLSKQMKLQIRFSDIQKQYLELVLSKTNWELK